MTSILKADTIQDSSGNNIINESSDTITIGASGDTITIPAGATLANSGTATGFGGITEIDMWLMTSNLSTTTSEAVITSNLSRSTTTGFSKLGTGMAVSSGAWTFPSTGFWLVQANAQWETTNNTGYNGLRIYATTDNGTYSLVSNANAGAAGGYYMNSSSNTIIDVTDTSNVKLKFYAISSANSTLRGTSSYKYTGFTFIRLGDT